MRSYYRGSTVACFCALSFFIGILVHDVPGLPDPGSKGPRIHEAGRRGRRLNGRRAAGGAGFEASDGEGVASSPGTAGVVASGVPASWANFTTFEELVSSSGMLDSRPPSEAGETGTIDYVVAPFQVLSEYPRAFLFPRFVPDEAADRIVSLAESRLAPSGLALKRGDTAASTRDVRTSSGTYLEAHEDPTGVLETLERRIAAVTAVPRGHGEAFNVLRYENGQHYHSHFDAFLEQDYGPQGNQRIATALIYLSDVEEGGETTFLLEGKGGEARLAGIDYTSCNATGIRVKPRKGDALVFWSVDPDGRPDKHSLHGGCPVIRGTKWVATKWIRNKCLQCAPTAGGQSD